MGEGKFSPGATTGSPDAASRIASDLIRAKKFEEADRLLAAALRSFSNHGMLYVNYAKSAKGADRPDEEMLRWQMLRDRFPNNIAGYIEGAHALTRAKRLAVADELLVLGMATIGEEVPLLAEHAVLASRAANWGEARTRWRRLEGRVPLDSTSTRFYTTALLKNGEVSAAQAHIEAGLVRFPRDMALRVLSAEIATANSEWAKALEIWRAINEDEPDNLTIIEGLGQAAWLRSLHLGEVPEDDEALEGAVDVGLDNNATIRKILTRFESLGRNCEFGLVQRRFGAEPLGLLRWTLAKPKLLVAGLLKKFEGVDNPDNTALVNEPSEIWVEDTIYGFRFHTFSKAHAGFDFQAFKVKQARHLSYLRNVFLDRLDDGETIYVYAANPQLHEVEASANIDGEVEEIYSCLNSIMPGHEAKLLAVYRADATHPAGSLNHAHDGLFKGYIGRFGRDRGRTWDVDFAGWTALCTDLLAILDPIS